MTNLNNWQDDPFLSIAAIEEWSKPIRVPDFNFSFFHRGEYPFPMNGRSIRKRLILVSADPHQFRSANRFMENFLREGRAERRVSQEFVDKFFRLPLRDAEMPLFINAFAALVGEEQYCCGFHASSGFWPESFLRRKEYHDHYMVSGELRGGIFQELCELMQMGKDKGATLAGLGSLTKIGGLDARLAEANILPIATGNRLTAVVQGQHMLRICALHGWEPEQTRVAIIGGPGSVGRALVLRLLDYGFPLLLVADKPTPLTQMTKVLDQPSVQIAQGTEGIKKSLAEAKIVVFLTTRSVQISPEKLAEWTQGNRPHIMDVSRPRALGERCLPVMSSDFLDDGGLVRFCGRHLATDAFQLGESEFYACNAEVMAMPDHCGHFGVEPREMPWDDLNRLRDYFYRVREEMKMAEANAKAAGFTLAPRRWYDTRFED